MAQHIHIDTAAVAAQFDKVLANNAALLTDPGSAGAQARIMQAVGKAWFCAVAEEMNRGTDPHDMLHAVPSVLANWLGSFACSLTGDVPPYVLADMMLQSLVRAAVNTINEPDGRNTAFVPMTEGGRA
jgi:hypothetical protein